MALATSFMPDAGTDDEQLMIDRLRDLYEMAKSSKSAMASEWKRHYRMTMNRAAPAVPNAPGTRANEVFGAVNSRIGWMTDQEIQFTVTPASSPFSMYHATMDTLAEQLEQVLTSVYLTDGWYAEINKMLWDSAMYGSGYLKAVWDAGMVQGMGNIALKHVSPWCLYPDPFARSIEEAQFIIEVHTMTPAEIQRRFPDVGKDLANYVGMTGDRDNDHTPPSAGSPGKQTQDYRGELLIPVNAGQGPTQWGRQGAAKRHTVDNARAVNVYECWFRENEVTWHESADPDVGRQRVVVDRWRVVVFSGNRILLDELADDLYGSDRHPYVRYVDFETGEFWGSPLLRDLSPCQQAMNTLLAMGQANIVFTGSPIMIGVKGSGVDRSTFTNRAGQVYDVNQSAGGQQAKPQWLPPPNLPAAVMEFIGFWRDEIERIVGLNATQRGEVPSGRATDKQVQAGQEAGFISVRSSQRNLELTLRKAGELLANLVVLNYDVPRWVAVVGEDGATSSIQLAARHFYGPTLQKNGDVEFAPMRFTLTVNAGSSKPTSRAARIAEANALHQQGAVDDVYLLQAYRVSHWQAVKARTDAMKQQQMQLAQAQAAAGQAAKSGGNNRTPSPKGPK